jgi:hypothetical protein
MNPSTQIHEPGTLLKAITIGPQLSPSCPLWVSNFQPVPPNMQAWIPINYNVPPIMDPPAPYNLSPDIPHFYSPDLPRSNLPIPVCPPNSAFVNVTAPQSSRQFHSGNYSTDEFGYGRVAKAIEPNLAMLLLKKFTLKYPLTGTKSQTAISVSSSGSSTPRCGGGIMTPETSTIPEIRTPEGGVRFEVPHPALIQQRLEELLLKKKERKIMAKMMELCKDISVAVA